MTALWFVAGEASGDARAAEVIHVLHALDANLRFLGAGGPKMQALAAQPKGRGKILVCNADEGDPGAYMDRSVLEGNPPANPITAANTHRDRVTPRLPSRPCGAGTR